MEPTLSRYVSLLLILGGLSVAAPSRALAQPAASARPGAAATETGEPRAAGENDPLNPPGDPIENSELLPATGFL